MRLQVFGRRLVLFWAAAVAAVLAMFHTYTNNYHDNVLSNNISSSSDFPDPSNSPDAPPPPPCPGSPDILMIIIIALTATYVTFQTALAVSKGISFSPPPVDAAIHRPGARATRLALLQQTCPLWDYQRKIDEARTKHASSDAVAAALAAAMQPFTAAPEGSSACVQEEEACVKEEACVEEGQATAEGKDCGGGGSDGAGAVLSFDKLLNVLPPPRIPTTCICIACLGL